MLKNAGRKTEKKQRGRKKNSKMQNVLPPRLGEKERQGTERCASYNVFHMRTHTKKRNRGMYVDMNRWMNRIERKKGKGKGKHGLKALSGCAAAIVIHGKTIAGRYVFQSCQNS